MICAAPAAAVPTSPELLLAATPSGFRVLQIDSATGALREASSSPVLLFPVAREEPAYLNVDQRTSTVYTVRVGDKTNQVLETHLNLANGAAATPLPDGPGQVPDGITGVQLDPSGRHAYLMHRGVGTVLKLSVRADGRLSQEAPLPALGEEEHAFGSFLIGFAGSGPAAYAKQMFKEPVPGQSGTVARLRLEELRQEPVTGALTRVRTLSLSRSDHPYIVLAPHGNFLYSLVSGTKSGDDVSVDCFHLDSRARRPAPRWRPRCPAPPTSEPSTRPSPRTADSFFGEPRKAGTSGGCSAMRLTP